MRRYVPRQGARSTQAAPEPTPGAPCMPLYALLNDLPPVRRIPAAVLQAASSTPGSS